MTEERFHVYIMAAHKDGPLYIGVTNNLARRVYEHKAGAVPGFTRRYNITKLMWCEPYANPQEAIFREKQLKKWRRPWKITLIEQDNPAWNDLADEPGLI